MRRNSRHSTKPNAKRQLNLANHEIVVLAAYLAGAWYKYVDTEDIAVRANELAPGRFTWRKYKQQINIDTVRKRLWDATKEKQGPYLIGSERGGWLVTELGCQFAEANLTKLDWLDLSRTRLSRNEETWLGRERIRMLAETAYRKFHTGDLEEITAVEAERFFRVDDYVVGDARKGKIERAKSAFANEPELRDAIQAIATLVREK
jgi:hypothetical protein